ncbi:MAG: hypothetical protein ABSB19_09855 [Methylomonas sp.]|jgi:hypothetical protein
MRISRTNNYPLFEKIFAIWLTLLIAALAVINYSNNSETRAQFEADTQDRYPYRLPDWFWQSPANAHLISPEEVLSTQNEIAALDALSGASSAKQTLESAIAERLASKFSVRDLISSANVVTGLKNQVSLAVLIDPSFDLHARTVLQDAAQRFIEVAFDPEVIKKAFDRSSQMPNPIPAIYELKDGAKVAGGINSPVYSEAYAFYLHQKIKPASIDAFLMQLRNVLSTPSGGPAVLMISRYSGDAWWGGGYNNFHSAPAQQLKREGPSCGYLYIELNSDKLRKPEPAWDDINFWASKIAHELLHNLGYWHPNYKSPEERDANNRENEWAFIVSYEFAILEKLHQLVI